MIDWADDVALGEADGRGPLSTASQVDLSATAEGEPR